MRLRFLAVLAVTTALVPALVECRDATQVIVVVTTDVPCDQKPSTSIAVGNLAELGSKQHATATTTCTGDGTIGQLVITPSGDNDAEVAFEIATGIGVDPSTCGTTSPSCIVARRQLRFIPHQTIRVDVPMRKECANVTCDPSLTCSKGVCASVSIDPTKCSGDTCDEGSLGTGAPPTITPTPTATATATTPPTATVTPTVTATAPPPPLAPTNFDLVWGNDYGCMLRNGQVYCFGTDDNGELGRADASSFDATPTLVPGITDAIAISAGATTVGVLKSDRTLWMWGDPGPQVIIGATATVRAPTQVTVSGVTKFDQLCIGYAHACALSGTTLWCWGDVLDPNTHTDPTQTTLDSVPLGMNCGDYNTVLLMNRGRIFTLGETGAWLGRGTASSSMTPAMVMGPALPASITAMVSAAQDTFVFGATSGAAWGSNRGQDLGGTTGAQSMPIQLSTPFVELSHVVAGYLHACGLQTNGVVKCWGDNSEAGQLGLDDGTSGVGSPTEVPNLPTATKLWAGGDDTCALTVDNEIWCWGGNDYGQLGNGGVSGLPNGAQTPLKMLVPQN